MGKPSLRLAHSDIGHRMSALGQNRAFECARRMSVLPPNAKSRLPHCTKEPVYSITSPAIARSGGGLSVFRVRLGCISPRRTTKG